MTRKQLLTKEQFTKIISAMQRIDDYNAAKMSLYNTFDVDGYIIEPTNKENVLMLLKAIFPARYAAIESFCMTQNYGRGKGKEFYIDPDGQKIPITSPEELYDYITDTGGDGESVSME